MTRREILNQHYALQEVIQKNYRLRDKDPDALTRAIRACEEQIAMSGRAGRAYLQEFKGSTLPAHVGYRQLAIILDKQNRPEDAKRLVTRALRQGWSGDWKRRLERPTERQKALF